MTGVPGLGRNVAALLGATDPTGTGAAIGVGTFLLGVAAYMFKELRRKDDSVWRIIAEKDKEIARLSKRVAELDTKVETTAQEMRFWRDRRLAEEDDAYEAAMRERRENEGGGP